MKRIFQSVVAVAVVLSCGCQAQPQMQEKESKDPEFRVFVPTDRDSTSSADCPGFLTGWFWSEEKARAALRYYPEGARPIRVCPGD